MDPKVLTFEEVTGLLESGDFDSFIGVRESANFEAKTKKPYRFTSKKNKLAVQELCKDVAGIANSSEPCHIVCGLIMPRKGKSTSRFDIVIRKQLLKEEEFYTQEEITKYLDSRIISPKIKVTVKWYSYKKDPSRGLGTITVQKQDKDNYFVIKILEFEGKKLKGDYYGIPKRNDDRQGWIKIEKYRKPYRLSPEDIERVHISLSNQLEEIRQLIKPKKPSVIRSEDSLKKKIEEALNG